jgi:outer membrane protein OmpA-like peptidoglycan-associated protein
MLHQVLTLVGFHTVLLAIYVAPINAQENPSKEMIICKLNPEACAKKSRSFRGVTIEPSFDSKPAAIDLYVNFEYNSAELKPEALAALRVLGEALNSPALERATVGIVGHTDAKGTADYNIVLSRKRANVVRNVLVESHGIDPSRLMAEGKGYRELKDPSRPEDGINRRVEVKNLTQ